MERIADLYCRLLSALMAAALMLMVVLVFGNVVLRYAFNSGITVSEELSRWLFVWLTFVGAVLALRNHAHLGMDSVVSRLPAGGKKVCFILSNLLMLYCLYLFFVGTWQQTLINIDNRAPATGLSSGWYYGVGLFFCIGGALIVLRNLFDVFTGRIAEQDLIQVRESEETIPEADLSEPPATATSPGHKPNV